MEETADREEEDVREGEENEQEMPDRMREESRAFDAFFDQLVHEARMFLAATESSGSPSQASFASSSFAPPAPASPSLSSSSLVGSLGEKRAEGAAFHLNRLKEAAEKLALIRRRSGSGGEGEARRRRMQAATLSRLEDQLIQERDRSATKSRRFSFRKKAEKPARAGPSAASASCASEGKGKAEADPISNALSSPGETQEGTRTELKPAGGKREEEGEDDICGAHTVLVENRTDEIIVFRPGDLEGRELILRDLDECLVVVADKIPAARVRRLRTCLVFSLWLFGCTKSLFALQTQQLRVHDSRDVAFLLRIFSSQEAVFGPQLLELRVVARHSVEADRTETKREDETAESERCAVPPRSEQPQGLEPACLWQDVKDFDWIKKQASPHWKAVPLCPPFNFSLAPLTLHVEAQNSGLTAPPRSVPGQVLEPNAPEWFSIAALRAAASAGALALRAAREATAGDRSVSLPEDEEEDEI
uniref:Tubulin-specific chaperone C n=1 Tax=Neospora caninum (strain Liverpool) TaxID=572307 RepID=A0A0F7UEE2_NEOCL|nr:TPA: Tubulin-specific chaperone C [Neospora caninum Liverpool]